MRTLATEATFFGATAKWWGPVQLKAGPNSVTLDQRNATPLN